MRLVSPLLSMDVDIEDVKVSYDTLILSGFAGVNDIEAHVSGRELCRLVGLALKWSVIGLLLRSALRLNRRRS